MFIANNTVDMVTYCVTKKITTCSPMIGQFFGSTIVASSEKRVVLTTHQNICAGNCFEPPKLLRGFLFFYSLSFCGGEGRRGLFAFDIVTLTSNSSMSRKIHLAFTSVVRRKPHA